MELMSQEQENQLYGFCKKLSNSRMIPQNFWGKPDDIFVTILYGKEFGISPINSLNSICVINGQVTMKAATMNAIVRNRCPDAIIEIDIDYEKEIVTVSAARNKDAKKYISRWDLARASKMNLLGKHNWKTMPIAMLQARAISEACRVVFSDVLLGLYSTEEYSDIEMTKDPETQVFEALNSDIAEFEAKERSEHPDWYDYSSDDYKFRAGKFKGKHIKDCNDDELTSYYDKLSKDLEKKTIKDWGHEVMSAISAYCHRNGIA